MPASRIERSDIGEATKTTSHERGFLMSLDLTPYIVETTAYDKKTAVKTRKLKSWLR